MKVPTTLLLLLSISGSALASAIAGQHTNEFTSHRSRKSSLSLKARVDDPTDSAIYDKAESDGTIFVNRFRAVSAGLNCDIPVTTGTLQNIRDYGWSVPVPRTLGRISSVLTKLLQGTGVDTDPGNGGWKYSRADIQAKYGIYTASYINLFSRKWFRSLYYPFQCVS